MADQKCARPDCTFGLVDAVLRVPDKAITQATLRPSGWNAYRGGDAIYLFNSSQLAVLGHPVCQQVLDESLPYTAELGDDFLGLADCIVGGVENRRNRSLLRGGGETERDSRENSLGEPAPSTAEERARRSS